MVHFILLVLGLLLVVKGADWLVDSATKVSGLLGIPSFIVGLTIVAFGTSAPEASIGVVSALKQTNGITLGNVVGSSIVNIAIVIGITSIITPLAIHKGVALKEIPMAFAAQVLLVLLAFLAGQLSRLDGILLLLGFLSFLAFVYSGFKKQKSKQAYYQEKLADEFELKPALPENEEPKEPHSRIYLLKLVALFLAGAGGLILGGNLVVDNSMAIAQAFGISEMVIGLTVVSFGTCLPELVTSVTAALRKNSDIAVGNIIGSNLFNILFVLGLSVTINPIPDSIILLDYTFMLMATILLFALSIGKQRVSRVGGAVFVGYYVLFIMIKLFIG